jgi:DNA replication initiation complex subunit (GINS family)
VLDLLTPAEQELYADLVNGAFGEAVRLEQERISFAALAQVVPVPVSFPST